MAAAATGIYNQWADFLLGLPQSMGKDVQYLNPATVRMPQYGMYIRDAWHVNRKLTLDYGLRYEFYPAPRRDHWAGERYDPNTDKVYRGGFDVGKGQIAPRLGIAYQLNDKTVIRTGGGISIDPNSFRYLRDAYPATISSQFSGAHQLPGGRHFADRTAARSSVRILTRCVFTARSRGHYHFPAGIPPGIHRVL